MNGTSHDTYLDGVRLELKDKGRCRKWCNAIEWVGDEMRFRRSSRRKGELAIRRKREIRDESLRVERKGIQLGLTS
jgi:hypothetical protein